MSRRKFIQAAGAVGAGLALSGKAAWADDTKPEAPKPARSKGPNILWICTDQQRSDTIASLGNSNIRTPNLDRLVSEGVAFTNAFAQNSVCTPSRASFLTGRYPRTNGTRQNGQAIPPDEVLVTKMLADAGYDCGLSGKLHIAPCNKRVEERIDDGYRVFHWSHDPSPSWGKANEYTAWIESKGYKWEDIHKAKGYAYAGCPAELHQTTWCFDRAIDFIKEKRTGPWMMSLNVYAPHHPFDPPKEYLDRYDPDKLPDPAYKEGELDNKPVFQQVDHNGAYGGGGMSFAKMTPRERREVTAAYYAMIEQIDDNVGRILKTLEETGQRENTVVIFTSDHGEMLGDHGIYLKGPHLYDTLIHVPLIFSWPGHFKAGLRSDALVELVDIVPTLLNCAGIPIPVRVQGQALNKILTGQADPHQHKDYVYAESYGQHPFNKDVKYTPMATSVRTRDTKFIAYAGMDIGELYDLKADPGEHDNLWDKPEHSDLQKKMTKLCFDASVLTQDPLPRQVAPW